MLVVRRTLMRHPILSLLPLPVPALPRGMRGTASLRALVAGAGLLRLAGVCGLAALVVLSLITKKML